MEQESNWKGFVIEVSGIIAVILFYGQSLCAQQVIPMGGHNGVLFGDTVKLSFRIDSIASRFSPSGDEAHLADKIISENKRAFIKSFGKSFNKEVKRSHRQFIGYINIKGDRHLIVFFLNMNRSRSKHYFKEWLTQPIVGFGDFYEKNLKILDVNLSQRRVTIF